MYSPNSGIVDPFGLTIALAENAAMNGVVYFFDREVEDIRRVDGIYELVTNDETYRCRWVVNAAGLGCGKVSDMLGITGYKVIGSKGDYIILDKRTGPLLPMPREAAFLLAMGSKGVFFPGTQESPTILRKSVQEMASNGFASGFFLGSSV